MPPLKVIISGGGTGGHIFPAIAIADAIKRQAPDTEILFVGAKGRMEMEKVPEAGYTIIGLTIQGLQRKISLQNILLPFRLLGSLIKAITILRSFRADVAVGVGGYASGPTLRMAALLGIPCIIQEQNSYPGITNRLLAKKAKQICVAFTGMEKYFPAEKTVLTGNPVRGSLKTAANTKKDSLAFFGLNPEKFTILVVGGSLGARTINDSISLSLEKIACRENLQVLWQTGKNFSTDSLATPIPSNVMPFTFIREMDKAYTAADIIISRAGAMSISELCIVGKPCILVPSPNVAEDHQTKNAKSLSENGAALLVPDSNAREFLWSEVEKLMQSPARMLELSHKIQSRAISDSDDRIAQLVIQEARKHQMP
jgi:UDP-N-acetylglucosamine--N-acetylmuramyl-(pentapeptide) pyrophosphoryl-undecaprenol N-acetylglucosamine transferase